MADLLSGVVVLVVLLAVVLGAGLVLRRLADARSARVWQPLVLVVDGSAGDDGDGSGSRWFDGTYGGRAVHARCAAADDTGRAGSGTTSEPDHAFEVVVAGGPGRADWRLLHAEGTDLWQLVSDDPALVRRLRAEGVVERVAALGRPGPAVGQARLPVLGYTAHDGRLHYREDAGPDRVPTSERFRAELEALLAVAEANARVNGA